jgi:4-diphosphocytidyl-2-C-methyl-D-erythritol kinase
MGAGFPLRPRTESEVAMVELLAPAKVNLFLRILAQERSGFHQLETLFCRLEFGDTLEVKRVQRGVGLEVVGAVIGPPGENLAFRAAQEFLDTSGLKEGVRIRLRKRIPLGAGLGGGSSDAAATLLGLATLFPDFLDGEQLLEIAGGLGSDVPFFLSPSPLALAWGRGDRIQPLPPLPGMPVVLALPPVEVSTPWAYGRLAKDREGVSASRRPHLFSPDSLSSWEAIGELAENDFEEVVFREHPLLKRIRRAVQEKGSLVTLLSGSGSALFGVFRSSDGAVAARADLQAEFPETRFLLTRTESRARDPRTAEGVEPEVGL